MLVSSHDSHECLFSTSDGGIGRHRLSHPKPSTKRQEFLYSVVSAHPLSQGLVNDTSHAPTLPSTPSHTTPIPPTMSFSDNPRLEAQPTTFRRSDDPQYRDDPEYDRLTESLSERIFGLTNNINTLSRQVELLGTRRETERVRERVQDLVEETGKGFKEIGEGLKKAGSTPDLNVSCLHLCFGFSLCARSL